METGTISDIHGEHTGMFKSDEHADQQEELDSAHRAYIKETPIRPWNLIIPIGLFLLLTLFLSWWDGHSKAQGFLNAFIKSDMLGVMLTALLATGYCKHLLFYVSAFSCRRACYPFY
ncbi:hypothetical protein KQR56_17380 [Bacillus velezensis]|nr:hypothetical protein [Bacillus velezensis]